MQSRQRVVTLQSGTTTNSITHVSLLTANRLTGCGASCALLPASTTASTAAACVVLS